ncbi:MAG: Fe-S cluster assembly protein SufB, partial [Halodesulfurarchaeum sp.]
MSSEENLQETDTESRFAFKKEEHSAFQSEKGLTEETIRLISEDKDEPEWMLERRLRALKQYQKMPMPTDWPGQPDLSELDVEQIIPYIRPDIESRGGAESWEDLPEEIQDTFDKLGIPEAEKEALSGVGAQYESEIVYQNMKEQWEEKGVIFMDMDKAVQEHPEIVKEYFMTKAVPPSDNKFAAL